MARYIGLVIDGPEAGNVMASNWPEARVHKRMPLSGAVPVGPSEIDASPIFDTYTRYTFVEWGGITFWTMQGSINDAYFHERLARLRDG